MKIFNLSRGAGKTMRMLYASEYHNVPILCATSASKKYIMDMAKWKSINIPEPIIVSEVTDGRIRGKKIKDILVDDMESVFRQMLAPYALNMIGGTITIDKEVSNGQENKSINI